MAQNKPKSTENEAIKDTINFFGAGSSSTISKPKPTNQSIKPQSIGNNVDAKFNVNQPFHFNRKIGFKAKTKGENFEGFFYFNTQNGQSWIPWETLKKMVDDAEDGTVDQILTNQLDFYNFMASPDGKFWMKMSGNNQSHLDNRTAINFLKTAKLTGKLVTFGNNNQFSTIEYNGKDDEGKPIQFYLMDSFDFYLDGKKLNALLGFMSLGYIADASGKTYLLVGFKNNEFSVNMTYNEPANVSFNGKSYNAMGQVMKEAIRENMDEFLDNFSVLEDNRKDLENENDSEIKKIKESLYSDISNMALSQIDQLIQFTQSSDASDLTTMNSPNYHRAYYNTLIKGSYLSFLELERTIRQMREANANTETINQMICQKDCARKLTFNYIDMKDEHLEALKIKNEDKRDRKVEEIIMKYSTKEPCQCY